MKNQLKKKIAWYVGVFLIAFAVMLFAQGSLAVDMEPGWHPSNYVAGYGLSNASVTSIFMGFMKWILFLVGLFGVIAFAFNGIQYLVSAGDERMIDTAKRNMRWSVAGVVVALSGLIVITEVDMLLAGDCDIFCWLGGIFGF